MIEDNITNLQKIAIEGEIAHALITSRHDADVKLRIYYFLKEISEKFKPLLIEIFKESTTFSEAVIDRLSLEARTEEVPDWLWIEKAIADLDLNLKSSELTFSEYKLSINRKEEKKKLIRSAFVRFGRVALLVSPSSAVSLFNEILKESRFSFLHTTCFYLKETYEESIQKGYIKGDEKNQKILNVEFNLEDLLSTEIETKSLNQLKEENQKTSETPQAPQSQPKATVSITEIPISKEIIMEGSITPTELSDFISAKVIELFQNSPSGKQVTSKESKIKYVVQKVYTDSNIKTDIRSCETEEEARKFIEDIKKSNPEQEAVCNFIIKKVQ